MCSREEDECIFGCHWFKIHDVTEEEFEELLELANNEGVVDGVPHAGFMQACKDGDLKLLRSLGTRGCQDSRLSWQKFWREAVSEACQAGRLEVLRYLLDASRVDPADLCPWSLGMYHRVQPGSAYKPQPGHDDYDPSDPNAVEAATSMRRETSALIDQRWDALRALETAATGTEKKRLNTVIAGVDAKLSAFDSGERWPIPNPAPPLYIAAACGHCELVTYLIGLGADPDQPAYDGTTPFYAACARSDMQMVRLLHRYSVDMGIADQDKTAPVHIAAISGHVKILQFLRQHGVSMETPGTVYLNDWTSALVNKTPLAMAQHYSHTDAVRFLQPSNTEVEAPVTERRARSDLSMEERARRAGVAERLKPIPRDIVEAIAHGSDEERRVAKKAKQTLQIANQKIVARAEEACKRQTALSF